MGCAAPSITGEPQSQTIRSGQTASLSVTATGVAPLSYQWYRGNSGDTHDAPLIAAASYWLRVGSTCGTADSAAATITVMRAVRRLIRRPR